MNFQELILLIQSRGEKVVAERVNAITTDKHLYVRMSGSESPWEERELPKPEEKFPPLPNEIKK